MGVYGSELFSGAGYARGKIIMQRVGKNIARVYCAVQQLSGLEKGAAQRCAKACGQGSDIAVDERRQL